MEDAVTAERDSDFEALMEAGTPDSPDDVAGEFIDNREGGDGE